jgi:putative hemolysin
MEHGDLQNQGTRLLIHVEIPNDLILLLFWAGLLAALAEFLLRDLRGGGRIAFDLERIRRFWEQHGNRYSEE